MKSSFRFPALLCIGFVIGTMLALAMSGCAANPFKAASGPDETAYAVLGSYAIYQRQALKIKADTTLPASLRDSVVKADAVAFPVLKALDTALVDFLNAKAALEAGTSTKEKLAIAAANLKQWTSQGIAAVRDLKAATSKADKTIASVPRSPAISLNPIWSV